MFHGVNSSGTSSLPAIKSIVVGYHRLMSDFFFGKMYFEGEEQIDSNRDTMSLIRIYKRPMQRRSTWAIGLIMGSLVAFTLPLLIILPISVVKRTEGEKRHKRKHQFYLFYFNNKSNSLEIEGCVVSVLSFQFLINVVFFK